MKTLLLLIVAVLFLVPLAAQSQIGGYPDFEIVESTPVETNLDNPDIRNAHEVWLEMINGAKTTLDIEQFYICDQKGEWMEDVLRAIVNAGERGVTVRIIDDANMHKTYPQPVDSLGTLKNLKVRIIDFGKLKGGIQHAKYFIVDGEQIFLGSQNFDWRALKHIHEIGVRIRNTTAVNIYQDIFNIDWNLSEKNDPALIPATIKEKQYPDLPIKIVEGKGDTLIYTPTMSPKGMIVDSLLWDETNIVRLIDGAAHDVMVQVLTYSPAERRGGMYTVLDSAFRRAAGRGVKVKLIVADWSIGKNIIDHLKSLSSVPNIEVKFTAIPEFSGGYISFGRVEHCKYLVVDSARCWIGTSNWEKSYFYNVRNLGVMVQNSRIASIMQRIFLKSWTEPFATIITADGEYKAREHSDK